MTEEDLIEWFRRGEEAGHDWMLVVSNRQSGTEFVRFVSPNRSLAYEKNLWQKSCKVLAVYDLNRPFGEQSDRFRTFVPSDP